MADAKNPSRKPDEEALALFKAAWEEAMPAHEKRCAAFDKQERAYHAELPENEKVGYHDLAPHYAYEVVELLASNLVDDHPLGKVKPLRDGAQDAAKLLEKVVEQHRQADARDEKLPLWVKRGLVHNLSPAKMSWDYQLAERTRRVFETDPFSTGGYRELPHKTQKVPICDRPTLTLMDPRDFIFDPHAKTLDECAYVLPRFYETKESLRRQEKKGDYGIYKNLDQIQPNQGSQSGSKKNRVVVVEYWTRERIIVVANHNTVIRDDDNPYWHGELPFVAMVLVPDLRKLEGMSVVETIEPLQRALWRSLNQRLDMAELVLNPPIVQMPGEEQIDEFKPGVRITSSFGKEAVVFADTPVQLLAAAIENAAQVKGDMRDISGAVPALSGAASETLDQKTATGISIIQSVAQQRLKRMRAQAGIAEKRSGRLELAMIQQLTRRMDAIRIDAKDATTFQPYTPADLQGDVEFDIDDVNESLDQQKRRDEATLKLQNALAVNAAQPGLINLQEAFTDFLEAFDEDDVERYFHTAENPAPMQGQLTVTGPPPGGPPGMPPGPGGPAPAPGPPPPPAMANGNAGPPSFSFGPPGPPRMAA